MIEKINDLNFERIYEGTCCEDVEDELEFTKEGLEIEYDILPWDDIKKAYKKLFPGDIL